MTQAPINLRRARKARERAEARRRGDANAALHGLSAAQRRAAGAEAQAQARKLDGARREAGCEDAGDDER